MKTMYKQFHINVELFPTQITDMGILIN